MHYFTKENSVQLEIVLYSIYSVAAPGSDDHPKTAASLLKNDEKQDFLSSYHFHDQLIIYIERVYNVFTTMG